MIRSLKVAPYRYKVIQHKGLSAAAGVLGACANDELHILMDPDSPPMVYAETLFHETLHAIWNQTFLATKYSSQEEEDIIYTLTPRIVALLRDNPKLVEELMRA